MGRNTRVLTGVLAILFLTAVSASAQTYQDINANEYTGTILTDAKVVEATDHHISVFARDGVEHVVAIDKEATLVTIEGKLVSLKDVREGDVITIELDQDNPVKFARNIELKSTQDQVARVEPKIRH